MNKADLGKIIYHADVNDSQINIQQRWENEDDYIVMTFEQARLFSLWVQGVITATEAHTV